MSERGSNPESTTEKLDREARRLGSLSTQLNRAVADYAGLHPTDWECLDILDWTGPASAGALAGKLGLTTGAVTGVVDRLEAAGWVRRERDVHDRRRVLVVPVWERAAELAPAFQPLLDRVGPVYEGMSERNRRVVLKFLREVNEALEEATSRLHTLTSAREE